MTNICHRVAALSRSGWLRHRFGGRLGDIAPVVLMGLLCLLFFWRLVTPDLASRAYIVEGDFTHQFYPFHAFTSQEIKAGRLPLWNPYIYAGHPFLADPQTAVFYPLGLATAALVGDDGLSFFALEWRLMLDFWLAAAFTYLLVRQLTGNRFAGLVSSATFTFGGFLTSYPVQQMPILETVVWLPLVLYCVERAARASRPLFWYASGGVALGIALLGGHAQVWYLELWTVLAYVVYRGVSERQPWRQVAVGLLSLAVFAGGTAALQLLPSAEFALMSNRGPVPYQDAGWGYEPQAALALLLPWWRPERAMYIGILPLFLAVASLLCRCRGTAFWGALAGVAFLLSLGDHTPVFRGLYFLWPGFNLFKNQERAMFLFALAGAVLAGYGAARCLDGGERMLAVRERIGRWSLNGLLFAAVASELLAVNWQNNIGPQPPTIPAATREAADFVRQQPGLFRVRPGYQEVYPPNYAILLGLQNPAGDSPMVNRWLLALLSSEQEYRLWQLLNVHYIITPAKFGDGSRLVYQAGHLNVYQVTYRMPRAWAVRDVRVDADEVSSLEAVLSRDFHPGKTVVLASRPAISLASPELPGDQSVEIVHYSPQRLQMLASVTDNAMLVLSEAYHPGWKAYLDGKEVSIYRANHALRAVELPAGDHDLVMVFDPLSFKLGAAVTLVTLLAYLLLAGQQALAARSPTGGRLRTSTPEAPT